jgi:proliferating cell nuclear antigen
LLTVRMSDTRVWKTCVGAIVNLLEEAHFKFTSEGVSMRAMDPSHVALVDFRLSPGAFEEYRVSKPLGLGLSLVELDRVLSRAKSEDALVMEYDGEKNRLLITFRGASSRRFSLPLLDLRESELPEPKLQFSAFVEVLAEVLQDGLRDSETVGENVRFEVGEEGFFMRAEGDGKSAELKLEKGSAALPKLKLERPCSSMFNVKYLSDMLKAADPKEPVAVSLGQDLPLRLDLRIAGGRGSLSFILAPRIESY